MKYYAVIDTNVIVSALMKTHDDSATVKIILKIYDGVIVPVYSRKIIAEYAEVLGRKKFKDKFTQEAKRKMIQAIIGNGIELAGIQSGETPTDSDDVVFYEVTMDARQEHEAYLVTGNIKDFPIKPFVVSPAEMMKIIEEGRES
ncbi:MAG: putative toxin-antitoxin system toxin component, PIN family [Bacteroides sp.]|nr:putative toxin-antitoxin system toxin component, PIN family [Prevotella sp.]MCM1408283.1 putative toxin-antitoxin system toxin component, PIN family [Treponema brennaborense]MCM1470485.1 putative toxin-antitoxin system toxin component, PIN family [Bacteroides sp.]